MDSEGLDVAPGLSSAPPMCWALPSALICPQERRAPLYLGGAEAAAVSVVPRADGEHAHQALLSPPPGLPRPCLLLGLQRRRWAG